MTRSRLAAAGLLTAGCLFASSSCYRPGDHKKAVEHPDTYAPLTTKQRAHVDALIAGADANPRDFATQKRAGLDLMNLTLSGALELQHDTERLLERAYSLDADDDELNRVLGRFYNMRAVEHDFSKAAWQQRVYASLLDDQAPAAMSDEHFVAYSFYSLAQIIELAENNKLLAALRRLRQLERDLQHRVDLDPKNVEVRALAGNFALFFAGYVPTSRRRRIDTGIDHFEYVRAHWADMRLGAKDERHCPNTYENFMFELAEAHLARKHDEQAQAIYRELAAIRPPVTRAKELVATVSQHRLDNLDKYRGELDLMPPWPSDVGNCVVCHSYTGDLPENTLFVHEPLALTQLPTAATAKPIDVTHVRTMVGSPREFEMFAEVMALKCGECHFAGGRASGVLDLTRYDDARDHVSEIADAIETGTMPPEQPLTAEEQQIIVDWVRLITTTHAPN